MYPMPALSAATPQKVAGWLATVLLVPMKVADCAGEMPSVKSRTMATKREKACSAANHWTNSFSTDSFDPLSSMSTVFRISRKHERQKTGKPFVGRNGTVVSNPQDAQIAFVSSRARVRPKERLALHFLHRLGT
jgi:hypothetical protein